MQKEFDLVVIGGGAAGFFCAIRAKELQPKLNVLILEKTKKLLTKVLVSGGGRCNVTHDSASVAQLSKAYPRGKTFLKKAFTKYWIPDVVRWFKENNVALKIEDDGRMFPTTDNSSTIANCFLNKTNALGIEIQTGQEVLHIYKTDAGFQINTKEATYSANKLVIASGGHQKVSQFEYLKSLNLRITDLCPSLFTFNLPKNDITSLMGVVVKNALVKIPILKMENRGALLITHWGMSGPAIIVLSSLAARDLAALHYNFSFSVDWLPNYNHQWLSNHFNELRGSNKQMKNQVFTEIPERFWLFLLEISKIDETKTISQLSKSELNGLIELLKNHLFDAKGKTTFKEEFVTCGGIDLAEIDYKTMQSKRHQDLYFCGEVLDIDAVTGGYNFQSAWTTAAIAANHLSVN